MDALSADRFELLVAEVLDSLPAEIAAMTENVVVLVADRGNPPDLLGLYDGVPLTERGEYGGSVVDGGLAMPDRIFVYRLALCEICTDLHELRREVAVTVIHEVAHHFGVNDDRLHELGWD